MIYLVLELFQLPMIEKKCFLLPLPSSLVLAVSDDSGCPAVGVSSLRVFRKDPRSLVLGSEHGEAAANETLLGGCGAGHLVLDCCWLLVGGHTSPLMTTPRTMVSLWMVRVVSESSSVQTAGGDGRTFTQRLQEEREREKSETEVKLEKWCKKLLDVSRSESIAGRNHKPILFLLLYG